MGAAAHLQVFVLLQTVDLALTILGIRSGATEANPGVLGVLAAGWPALVAVKLLFLTGVVALLVLHGGPAWARMMGILNGVYGGIVGWNLGILLGSGAWVLGLVGAALVAALPYGSLLAMEATRRWVVHQGVKLEKRSDRAVRVSSRS